MILGKKKSQNTSNRSWDTFKDTAATSSQLNISTGDEVFNFFNVYYETTKKEQLLGGIQKVRLSWRGERGP